MAESGTVPGYWPAGVLDEVYDFICAARALFEFRLVLVVLLLDAGVGAYPDASNSALSAGAGGVNASCLGFVDPPGAGW